MAVVSIEIVDSSVWSTAWHSTWWHSAAWHTSWHSAHTTHVWHSTCSWLSTGGLVNFHHDWIELCFKLLLLRLIFLSACIGIAFEELKSLCNSVLNGFFVLITELILYLIILECVLHLEAVIFKPILGINFLSELFVFILILLSVLHHLLNLVLG